MYIYNVTTNIEESVQNEWLDWMKNVHLPEMLETGKFSKVLMTRVMVKEQMGGVTYSVQYTAESKEMLQRYYDEDAVEMRSKSKAFEGKFVAFRTEMEVVKELTATNK